MKLPQDYTKLKPHERRAVREEYVKVQKGMCSYCRASLKREPAPISSSLPVDESLFPKNFFKWPIHLHHDHKTGMTIGAVHAHCNAVMWQYHGE